ncbi:MAG: hypothetical protein ACK5T0_08230 [Vampirovibrionales bacterium]
MITAPKPPKMKDSYPEGIAGVAERGNDREKIDLYYSARELAELFSERAGKTIPVGDYERKDIQESLTHFHNDKGEVAISEEKYPNLHDAYHNTFKPLLSEKPASFSVNA